jgi:hypothetical protein
LGLFKDAYAVIESTAGAGAAFDFFFFLHSCWHPPPAMSISSLIFVLPVAEHPPGAATATACFATFFDLASTMIIDAQRITKTKRTLSFIVAVISVKLRRDVRERQLL